jgi:transposase
MRFVVFTKRCDVATLIQCIMLSCEYFGGLPRTMLTDRMKTVLLQMDGSTPVWNELFADFVAAIGVAPRVCRAYTPQTKGKVERSIGIIKTSFWPGVCFTDLDHLNATYNAAFARLSLAFPMRQIKTDRPNHSQVRSVCFRLPRHFFSR